MQEAEEGIQGEAEGDDSRGSDVRGIAPDSAVPVHLDDSEGLR